MSPKGCGSGRKRLESERKGNWGYYTRAIIDTGLRVRTRSACRGSSSQASARLAEHFESGHLGSVRARQGRLEAARGQTSTPQRQASKGPRARPKQRPASLIFGHGLIKRDLQTLLTRQWQAPSAQSCSVRKGKHKYGCRRNARPWPRVWLLPVDRKEGIYWRIVFCLFLPFWAKSR